MESRKKAHPADKIPCMKRYLCLLALLTVYNVHAQTKKQTVSSSIEKVTVFMKGAQIVRSATTTIPAGTTTLVFQQISPELEEKSIQVQGKGAFTILSVARDRNYLRGQQPVDEITQLRKQQSVLEEQLQKEKNRLKVLAQEETMLSKNQDIRGTNTGLKTQDLREAMDFQRNRLTEVLEQQLTVNKSIRMLTESIDKLQAQQNALMAAKDSSTSDLLITVSSKESISGKLTLSYLVKNAGWYPSYELRVESINQPMEMAYKANVFQQCGEEWKNVKLSLSNGNPAESGLKPQLQPWRMKTYWSLQEMANDKNFGGGKDRTEVRGKVMDESGAPLHGASIRIPNRSIGTITNERGEFSLQLPPDAKTLEFSLIGFTMQKLNINTDVMNVYMHQDVQRMEEVVVVGYGTSADMAAPPVNMLAGKVAGVQASKRKQREDIPLQVDATFHTTSVNFDIATAYTIPSDGKPYAVSIQQMEVPTTYEYHAVPKMDLSAYLLAGITDWEQLNLLEGEASIYFEGTYLGKSLLNLQTASDTLFVSLGKDKNIVLNRTLEKTFSKQATFFGSTQSVIRNWEISVRNNKREPIRIVIEDQLPISVQKEIEISRVEYSGAKLDENTQQVTWDMNVSPKEEKKMKLQYTVKFPRGRIVNLD